MNTDRLKSHFLNIILIIGLSFLYCISGGLFQLISGMIISVLIGCSVTKHHYLFVGAESALVLAVITLFYAFAAGIYGAVAGVTAGVLLVLLGIGLGLSSNLKMHIGGTVLMCGTIYLVNMLIGFGLAGETVSYKTLLDEMRVILSEALTSQYGSYPEIISGFDEIISEMMSVTFKFLPAIFVCSAGASGLILTFIYNKVIVKLNKNIKTESLSALRAERSMGIMFLVIIIIALSMQDALMLDAILNLILILCFVFYICGLSYIDCLIRYKGKNRTFRTITVIVVLPLITMIFAVPAVIIAGIGFVDSLADFRKQHSLREDNDGVQ